MKKYKIYIYAICKNESSFINRWMDSVKEADGVVVVDTGSNDDSVALLRARGAIVYEETFIPWRFDAARNSALNHLPVDTDICVSIDIDEVFEPGWREKLEHSWNDDTTLAKYWYVWETTANGQPQKKFQRDKIHTRHGYQWVHPVHEVLSYSGPRAEAIVFVNDLLLFHRPDPTKSRGQYLPLLELSSKENPDDDRTKFWLGREYIYHHQYDQAIQTLKAHLNMPSSTWNEERCASMRYIAKAYRLKSDYPSALTWLYRAVAECPDIREPWFDLTVLAYSQHNWPLVYFAAIKALDIKICTESYLTEAMAWDFSLYDYAAVACYWLGFYQEALIHSENALKMSPNNSHLLNNIAIIKDKLSPPVKLST
ncbi:MAG: glycosyltransferase [Lachnospiraceae bacterium]|jgi:tetratricopeptide (TPR) repeat protein|nr:glycosyltransferase [Lachnospiraceae bacterium]